MANERETGPRESLKYGDALLHCLEIISGLLNYRVSTESFKAGLPIGPKGFSPAMLLQAAERFNFKSKIVARTLNELSSHLLPCILMMRGGKACVLVAIDEFVATVFFPEEKKHPKPYQLKN